MSNDPATADAELAAFRQRRTAESNAGTVGAIATTGSVASKGVIAAGAYSAYQSGGLVALRCFGTSVVAPIAGAMAGAWISEQVGADEAVFRIAQRFGAKRMAEPGRKAAHLGHQVAHDNAFNGILAGLAAGVAVGALIAFTIGTGGLGPLLGAAVLFGSGAAGGFIGAAVGGGIGKIASLCGPISSGSPNVFFERRPAARVMDTADCTRHPGRNASQIIEGSETVFINARPMARIGHRLSCDAVVQEGCETVLGDLTTQSFGPPDASLSVPQQLLLSIAEVAGARSASRSGGLLNKQLRRVAGEPVDVVTGDYADERVDFLHPGLLPLRLVRTYPGRMRVTGMLGPRWICNWSQRLLLDREEGTALLEDAGGERLLFAIGDGDHVHATHLKAPHYRLDGTAGRMRLFDSREQHFLLFAPAGDPAVLDLVAIEDRNGNRILFDRDEVGRLERIRHCDGSVFHAATTPEGWLTALWLEGGDMPLVSYEYDTGGHLSHVDGAFTGQFHYSYTPQGWLSGWRDGGPTRLEIAYDEAGRVVATRAGDGMFDDRFDYAPETRTSRHTDTTGAITTFRYDENNLLTQEQDPLGAVTVLEWDALERLQRRIDPAGRETRFSYDGDGRMVGRTDWAGRSSRWDHDRWGQLTAASDAEGSYRWTHDPRGNLVAWEGSDGSSGTATYDERGARIEESVAGVGATQWETDHAGRPVIRRDPGDRVSHYRWDRFGRLTGQDDPSGRTSEWRYERAATNPRGAVSHATAPDGAVMRFEYDGEGQTAARIRGDGQETRFEHGAFDTLRRMVDPLDAVTAFDYDGVGRLASVTDAAGQQWRFRYDAAGRLAAQRDWAGRETLYERDVLGRVCVRRAPDGVEQRLDWDDRDRIVRVVTGDDAISYAYDAQDRIVSAETWRRVEGAPRRVTELVLTWDEQGRLTEERQNGVTIAYAYDRTGRCVGRTSPSGKTALAYDEAGLLRRYESNGHALRFTHDASGLETLRQGAAIGTRTAFELRQSYDPAGRLAEQSAGGVVAFTPSGVRPEPSAMSRRYHWDEAGRLAGVSDSRLGETRYTHDERDQTVAVARPGHDEAYRYDALMNLVEGLGGEHRYWRNCLVEAGPNRFRYDGRGRMVERIETADGFRPRRWRYHWDGFDRLAELETPDGARWRYDYDAFGRRVAKELVSGPTRRRTDYLWQGGTIAEAWQRGGDGGVRVERWHYEADGLRPLAKELVPTSDDGEAMPTRAEWLPVVADQIGSPQALFGADGECRWRAEQRLWGRTRTARAVLRERHEQDGRAALACSLRFPGQWEDEESGLHYNLNRYYDPDTGQYLSPDPIGLDGGLRTQAYVSDPLAWMDPEGLAGCSASGGGGVSRKVAAARARQHQMLKDDVGFNISPRDWDQYPTIGRSGTFVTDRAGAMKYFKKAGGTSNPTISPAAASKIEADMGLEPGTLQNGFKVRQVTGIRASNPSSPLEGNRFFRGGGQHLPGGAPEMVINSIPTIDNSAVTTILNVGVK